jgi:all-trans-retinol 13,14-reductase
VLNGSWHEFGVPPKSSSFAGHSLYRANTMGGTFFPVGGTAGLGHQIVPTIEGCGGSVVLSAPVKKVLIQNGQAVGVELESGNQIKAKRVISSIGVKGTFSRLIEEEHLVQLPYQKLTEQVESTCSASGLFIGLNGTNEELQLPAHPVVNYRSYDHQTAVEEFTRSSLHELNYPYIYMISQSGRDPAWREKHPGKSSLLVCVYDQINRYSPWQGSTHQNRPAEYLEYKEKLKEFLLKRVFEQYPQLRDKVEIADAFTPLTVKQYGSHPSGEVYGLAQSPVRFEQKWLRPDTSIHNLFLTGVDVTTSSIVGAMLSGATTALNILGPVRGRKILNRMMPWKFNIRSPEYYK